MTSSGHHRLAIAVLAFIHLCSATGAAQMHEDVALLSADKNSFTLFRVAQDSGKTPLVVGNHDELGLTAGDRDNLAAVFTDSGLSLAPRAFPVRSLQLAFTAVSEERADVAISAGDSLAPPSELLWSSDSSVVQPAGEFWPGDLFVFDGNATINGEVGGSVLIVGGDLVVREAATIRGDVVVVGGILRQRGDGKIYGRVFAPGGHRRPRLSVTRAWEFEEEGISWGPMFSYDRVDGARLGAHVAYQKSAYSPRLSLLTAYALASETWQYRFRVSQRILREIDIEVQGAIFRLTETDDEPWVGRHANTVYSLFAGSDYRDYYGADGGEIGVTYKYRERGVLSATYRNFDYRWLDAEQGLWHLFRSDHRFRRNFSTVPDDILSPWIDRMEERASALHVSVSVEPPEDDEHLKRFDAAFKAQGEIAGGALGGEFDYDRWQFSAKGEWNGRNVHRFTVRLWYGKGRRDLPPNKLFYLGGVGSLPGYPQKTFVGSQAVLGAFEYRFDFWPNEMYDGGVSLFFDIGRATFADDFFDLSEFKSDVGIGLSLGDGLRIDIAKGLDQTERDIRLSLRLWQSW